jgi:anti-sigma factor RsiW
MNEMHPSIEQIVDYLRGELTPAQDAAVYAHIGGCRSCDDRRAEELAITEAVRANARASERDLPPALVTRIRDAAAQTREPLWEPVRALFRPMVLVPAAVAAAAVFYAGFNGWQHATTPVAINSSDYVSNYAAMSAGAPFGDDAPPVVLTAHNATR